MQLSNYFDYSSIYSTDIGKAECAHLGQFRARSNPSLREGVKIVKTAILPERGARSFQDLEDLLQEVLARVLGLSHAAAPHLFTLGETDAQGQKSEIAAQRGERTFRRYLFLLYSFIPPSSCLIYLHGLKSASSTPKSRLLHGSLFAWFSHPRGSSKPRIWSQVSL